MHRSKQYRLFCNQPLHLYMYDTNNNNDSEPVGEKRNFIDARRQSKRQQDSIIFDAALPSAVTDTYRSEINYIHPLHSWFRQITVIELATLMFFVSQAHQGLDREGQAAQSLLFHYQLWGAEGILGKDTGDKWAATHYRHFSTLSWNMLKLLQFFSCICFLLQHFREEWKTFVCIMQNFRSGIPN